MSSSASTGRSPHANRDHRGRTHWRHGGDALCEGGTRSRGVELEGSRLAGAPHYFHRSERACGFPRRCREVRRSDLARHSMAEDGQAPTERRLLRKDRHRRHERIQRSRSSSGLGRRNVERGSREADAQGPVGEGLQHDGLEDPRDGVPTRGRRPACHLSCRRRSAGEIGRCETHRGNRVYPDRHRLSARRRATATARLAHLRATAHGPPGTGPPSMSPAPPRSVFTSRERRIIEAARTPERVQRWLESLPYNHEERGETLRTFRGDWRLSPRNVWAVEQALIRFPHRRFRSSDARYRHWHEKYLRYKERYPDRRPVFYPGRHRWL